MQHTPSESRRGHAPTEGSRDYDPAEHAIDRLLPGARATMVLCLLLMAVLVVM